MSKSKNIEYRSNDLEIREVSDTGHFEGYITVWGVIDSYDSVFIRGSFTKTISERGAKVKVFYNHEELIGANVSITEDDHGVFVRGKLNLDVQRASDVHKFMKDGTLEGLSFSFRTLKHTMNNGTMEIREVKLFEYGPVNFPSGEASLITDVRSEDIDLEGESRSENFEESLNEEVLYEQGLILRYALSATLNDIWAMGTGNKAELIGKLDLALAGYHSGYLKFADKWISTFWKTDDDEQRANPLLNKLSTSVNAELQKRNVNIKELASDSCFTADQLEALQRGELVDVDRDKLNTLSDDIQIAYREERNSKVEKLCVELRTILTDSEKTRISTLLAQSPDSEIQARSDSGIDTDEADDISEMLSYFKNQ